MRLKNKVPTIQHNIIDQDIVQNNDIVIDVPINDHVSFETTLAALEDEIQKIKHIEQRLAKHPSMKVIENKKKFLYEHDDNKPVIYS